jgi:ATP-dependent 26S proteasome regulatory subunit
MSLDKVDFEGLLDKTENFSGADIKAVCTEAGYFAIRENRDKVLTDDFIKAVKKVNVVDELEKDAASMFG